MRVVAVCVGLPAEIRDRGRVVSTGIFKREVMGKVAMIGDNIVGDGQADRSCHGGKYKAVYAYPWEHYDAWEMETARSDFVFGQFGENLTVEGLLEANVCLGDRWAIGGVVLEVTQPRMPCHKLGIRMSDPAFPKRFRQSGRSGFYLSIIQHGEIEAGDQIEVITRERPAVAIATVLEMCYAGVGDAKLAGALSMRETLGMEWREPLLQFS